MIGDCHSPISMSIFFFLFYMCLSGSAECGVCGIEEESAEKERETEKKSIEWEESRVEDVDIVVGMCKGEEHVIGVEKHRVSRLSLSLWIVDCGCA